jgi:NAD-dependent deacetylase
MSTESGLPDFRSSGGLWTNNRRFEELASIKALEREYPEFLAFYRWRLAELAKYQPHEGHRVIARWQREGRVQALITQNVDGFHDQAGSPDVIPLHGSLRAIRCARCRAPGSLESFMEDERPSCDRCGGPLRPGVVLFGEPLDATALARAEAASEQADLFLVLGSSLMVSPANWFPQIAKAAGARLVIVNHDPTPYDELADLTLSASIRETLLAVDAALAGC